MPPRSSMRPSPNEVFFPTEELDTYCRDGSRLTGHVSHAVPGVELSIGLLGHGMPIATGMAIAARAVERDARVFCLLSDGECDEGSNWEAILFAPHHHLDNLVAIVEQGGPSRRRLIGGRTSRQTYSYVSPERLRRVCPFASILAGTLALLLLRAPHAPSAECGGMRVGHRARVSGRMRVEIDPFALEDNRLATYLAMDCQYILTDNADKQKLHAAEEENGDDKGHNAGL